jgi:glycosyltransferase involved in cell wall biosynthesis
MLVKNTFTHDARVWRAARTLQNAGHQVQVVALSAPGLPTHEITSDGIQIARVSRGPGAKLRGVSDPTRVTGKSSKQRSLFVRLAVKVVKFAAKTPLSSLVQAGIDVRMASEVLKFNPDVIHAHDLDTLELGSRLKLDLKIPLVYDSHEIATDRNHHNQAQKLRAEKKESKLISNADFVIMVSHGCAQFTAGKYGITLPTVIMNTPDYDPAKIQIRDLRRQLNIPENHMVLVHQGSLQKNRGVEQTIDAVSNIPNITYVIIGYGQHRPFLENYVERNGLSGKVKFFGPVPSDELIEWTASADIGICTIVGKTKSYLYSMPNKLFEYTMAGLPVVASNYPDMGAFVTENQMGITCDPESPAAIADAINMLLADNMLREKLANGAKIARTAFNWENEHQKLLEIYSKL